MVVSTDKNSGKTEPKPLPRVRLGLVDVCGRLARAANFPRSLGEIYGLLYMAPKPMSAPEICSALSISKGSVSMGTRQFLALGFIRKVCLQKERKDHFEVVLEMGDLIRSAYDSIFKVRAQKAERRLGDMVETLAEAKVDALNRGESYIKHIPNSAMQPQLESG